MDFISITLHYTATVADVALHIEKRYINPFEGLIGGKWVLFTEAKMFVFKKDSACASHGLLMIRKGNLALLKLHRLALGDQTKDV